MTGMKTGAGDDPFAEDDTDDEEAVEPDKTGETEPSHQQSVDHTDTSTMTDEQSSTGGTRTQSSTRRQAQIPYKLRRDGVQDGRRRFPLFLKEETKQAEREAQRELERRFDNDVSLTDLREALMLTGLNELDAVEAQLEKWGYGITFDD